MGMIKPCHTGLDGVLSSHMTDCDSQAPAEQIKWQWQFAVSRATVQIVITSQMWDLSTKEVFDHANPLSKKVLTNTERYKLLQDCGLMQFIEHPLT